MKITVSSSNKIHFNKTSEDLLCADYGYELKKVDGLYYIHKNGVPVTWSGGFIDVNAAEKFLSKHDYVNATEDSIDYNSEDFDFLINHFGFHRNEDTYISEIGNTTIYLKKADSNTLELTTQYKNVISVCTYNRIEDVIAALETLVPQDIFNSVMLSNTDLRQEIILAKSKGSKGRDFASNLVRVKSSNLWAYGMNMKDNKVGDLIIQFKGKYGGPGDVYMYFDVPVTVWRKFISAPSKGHYFWVNIRNNFWYRKLTGNKKGVLKNAIN